MTQQDIIKLAHKYGFTGGFDAQGNQLVDQAFVEALGEVAASVRKETLEEMIYEHPTTAIEKAVAYEREACAKVCEERYSDHPDLSIASGEAGMCAYHIRARGNQC